VSAADQAEGTVTDGPTEAARTMGRAADASEFVRVASLDELEEATPKRVVIDGTPVSVVLSDGEVYAIHDVCSHANVSLSEGDVEETTIECWLHGSRFDLHTGQPTGLPATEPVPVYPVEIRDGDVYVSLAPTNGVNQP
jgi:3-phenylpropionate/trans-cinnamate dioxygenase ferredoxin component